MKLKIISLIIITTLALSACANATPAAPTPDIQLAYTSAAKTVVAEFTLTAAAMPPTPEPSPTQEPPTLEPTATQGIILPVVTNASGVAVTVTVTQILCDAMSFDPLTVDVDVPDGTTMSPGQEFVKTWKIKNSGSCVWGAGYGLVFSYGDKMAGVAQPIAGVVEIGQEVEVKVSFKAPDKAGEYLSAWQMANAKGVPFGKPVYVKILVK
jgi:hypothetical protein